MSKHVSAWELVRRGWETFKGVVPEGCDPHVRWADICAPAVIITPRAYLATDIEVYWGGQVKWNVKSFGSIEDAKQAVDTRLRQLGYVLPADGPSVTQVFVNGVVEPPPLDAQHQAYLNHLQQRLDEAVASSKKIELELADAIKRLHTMAHERDALLGEVWYGPWQLHDRGYMVRLTSRKDMRRAPVEGPYVFLQGDATPRWAVAGVAEAIFANLSMTLAMQAADQALLRQHPTAYLVGGAYEAPQPATIWCPKCDAVHVDVGELAWQPHRTHQCLNCKHTFPVGGPGEFYVGIDPRVKP